MALGDALQLVEGFLPIRTPYFVGSSIDGYLERYYRNGERKNFTRGQLVPGFSHLSLVTHEDGTRWVAKGRRYSVSATATHDQFPILQYLAPEVDAGLQVVRVYGLCDPVESTDGKYELVMEFVPGESLTDAVEKKRVPVVCRALLDMCHVVRALWNHGNGRRRILHRDMKPDNVIVRPDRRAILTDFDLASMEGVREYHPRGRVVSGTIEYLAPETILGEMEDERRELHAMGTMLYKTLTGKFPFSTGGALVEKITTDRTATKGLMKNVPPEHEELRPLIRMSLPANPDDRDFDGFAEGLEGYVRSLE